MSGNGRPSTSQTAIVASVTFYMVTSIVMVMVNKWVLNSVSGLPLLFLWLQIVIAVILMYISSLFGVMGIPKLRRDTFKAILPMITINIIVLAVNTYCLKYVDASLYQVARSLVLPITVALTWVWLQKPSSPQIVVCCSVVVFGFFSGMFFGPAPARDSDKVTYPFLGPFTGMMSSVLTAIHSILIKAAIEVLQGKTMDLVWYNNSLSAIGLLPLVLLTEDGADQYSPLHTFIVGSIITGIFGFLINIAGTLQIQVTSPITHMVSSAVRGVLQTVLAVLYFGDTITASKLMGIVAILGGSCGYTYVRHVENLEATALRNRGAKPV